MITPIFSNIGVINIRRIITSPDSYYTRVLRVIGVIKG